MYNYRRRTILAGRFVMFCHLNRAGFARLTRFPIGTFCARFAVMRWFTRLRRSLVIITLYGIGILEAYYLPRYGIEWLLVALGATAFLAGFWIRTHWDI